MATGSLTFPLPSKTKHLLLTPTPLGTGHQDRLVSVGSGTGPRVSWSLATEDLLQLLETDPRLSALCRPTSLGRIRGTNPQWNLGQPRTEALLRCRGPALMSKSSSTVLEEGEHLAKKTLNVRHSIAHGVLLLAV